MRLPHLLFTLAVLFCFPLFSFAQNSKVVGKVVDENNKPLEFAAVLLFNNSDSMLTKSALTDENGNYELPNIPASSYFMEIRLAGYAKIIQKDILVNANETLSQKPVTLNDGALEEVTVTAMRQMVEIRPDMTVFNVEGTINSTGQTALDLLRKSPGVVLDQNNNINLKGKSGVQVYIDGRPSPFQGDDLTNYLRNLNAAQIDRIELISNPSSKYDAAGTAGIINIRLKKAQNVGFNGSINLDGGMGFFHKAGATVNGNYRNKNFNVFGTYGYYDNIWYNQNRFRREQSGNYYDQTTAESNDQYSQNMKFGTDFFINSRNTIGFIVNGNLSRGLQKSGGSADIGPLGSSRSTILRSSNTRPDTTDNFSYNLNYRFEDTSGVTFNIDADYGQYRNNGTSLQPNHYYNAVTDAFLFANIFANTTRSDIDIYTLKTDYERNLFGGKIAIGAKYAQVVSDNDFKFFDVIDNNYIANAGRTNRFKYDEKVTAGYVNFNREITKKLKFQGGLRAEHTRATGDLTSLLQPVSDTLAVDRTYTNLFPSAGFTYDINQKHALGITYSRRINRPNYQALNPFEIKLDELTYQKGNPLLQPQFAQNFELSHTFMGFVQTSLSYSHVNDVFAEIVLPTTDSSAYLQTRNVATQNNIGLSLSAPLPIKKWWNGYMNLNLNRQANRADFGQGNVVDISAFNFNMYMQHTFDLGKGYKAEVSGWYSSAGIWGGAFRSIPMGEVDFGLQKTVLKNKGNLRLSVNDPFFTAQWGGVSRINGFTMYANGFWESRQVKLNFNYNFGNMNVKENRRRSTGIEDESKRVGK